MVLKGSELACGRPFGRGKAREGVRTSGDPRTAAGAASAGSAEAMPRSRTAGMQALPSLLGARVDVGKSRPSQSCTGFGDS
jgi:hypothetical protein